jgi:4-hydroxy-tetrahydrodipicolinate reductase
MSERTSIPVVVNGAGGKMGLETIKAIAGAADVHLFGAIDRREDIQGEDAGILAGCGALEVPVSNDLQATLAMASQQKQLPVMVDFTHPNSVYENVRTAIAYGVRPVVGTTGLSNNQLTDLTNFAEKASVGVLVVPNFSIGVILMQQAAMQAAKYFDCVEIIELHHNRKADAPSGTAIKSAQLLGELGKSFNPQEVPETELIPGARGAIGEENIRIHSVRLPGYIAHQEMIFGAPGQIYTLRHDAMDRACYMPGVLLAIRKIVALKTLIYGLEKIL